MQQQQRTVKVVHFLDKLVAKYSNIPDTSMLCYAKSVSLSTQATS
jgi:hypothetical protein